MKRLQGMRQGIRTLSRQGMEYTHNQAKDVCQVDRFRIVAADSVAGLLAC